MALPPLPCLYCPPDGSPCERCDDDGPAESAPVRELAIDLGNLTGVWKDVYARQDTLYAKHQRKARTAWRKATAGLDLASLITAFRRQALMIDGTPAPGTDHESPAAAKHHKAELRNLARSMAAGFLMGVNDQPDYAALLAAVAAALTAASGEGTAAALAVSAAGAGYTGFAWAKASRDGQQEPDDGTVTAWAAKIIAGAVTDLASALAAGAIAGASAEAMLTAASAVLSKGRSVTAFLGQAMQSAVSAAMNAAYAALGGIELLDWLTAGDGKVCPRCDSLADAGPYSPRDYPAVPHPNCVPGDVLVSAQDGIRAGYARWYEGELVIIRTASGKELPVTPNHPVATPEGWVAAGELKVGQSVLSYDGGIEFGGRAGPDHELVPARICDVVNALREAGPVPSVRVPASAEQFHGDGGGGDVEIVWADGLLEHDRDVHGGGDGPLVVSGTGLESLPRGGLLGEFLGGLNATASSVMSSAGEAGALLGSCPGHAGVHRRTAPAGFDSGPEKPEPDDGPARAERLSDGLLAFAGQIARDDGFRIDRDLIVPLLPLVAPPSRHSSSDEPVTDRLIADAESFADLLATLPGSVAADRVVHIDRDWLKAHVYNLDTVQGWYFANSIVTHNCRCVPQPSGGLTLPLGAFAAYLIKRTA